VHYAGADGVFGRRDIKLMTAENGIGLDRTDPAAKDDITDINNLSLPVNRPALIRLTSKDVIHSFGSVEMRVKQDVVPGLEIPVWFIPSRVGEYEISCSQLCGLGHYRMRGFMSVKSEADYQQWMAEQAKSLAQ
jgi:cytochrome c oxidase subunit 2